MKSRLYCLKMSTLRSHNVNRLRKRTMIMMMTEDQTVIMVILYMVAIRDQLLLILKNKDLIIDNMQGTMMKKVTTMSTVYTLQQSIITQHSVIGLRLFPIIISIRTPYLVKIRTYSLSLR
jgi:hypothetical protein